ncbi:Uncharacterised protein [Mycobacteroides abscessus subsp. abscessus]|nr:Uncharacterised protein [Mycobacteroides abscessus subsp. abscessus]
MIDDPLLYGYSRAVAVAAALSASFFAVTISIVVVAALLSSALVMCPSAFGLPTAATGLMTLLVAAYLLSRRVYRGVFRLVMRVIGRVAHVG